MEEGCHLTAQVVHSACDPCLAPLSASEELAAAAHAI